MTNKLTRIAGFGLEAVLRDGNQIEMIDSKDSSTIVILDGNKHPRALAQFRSNTNYRAGQHSTSKMGHIVECLLDVPEMQPYL